jgi:hypothetical protein
MKSVLDFGADPTYVKECATEFQAALDASEGEKLVVPKGQYKIERTLHIKKPLWLCGEFSGGWYCSSILQFVDGVHGLVIDPPAYHCTVESLAIKGIYKQYPNLHGLVMQSPAAIKGCWINCWTGPGIRIEASTQGIAGYDGVWIPNNTANCWYLERVHINECDGDGISVEGYDTNAGIMLGGSVTANKKMGIRDRSALGNTYLAPQTAGNGEGPYSFEGGVNASVGVGLYSEGDQSPCFFSEATWILGGTFGAGHKGGQVMIDGNSHILLQSGGGSVPPLAVMDRDELKAGLIHLLDRNGKIMNGFAKQGTLQLGLLPGEEYPMQQWPPSYFPPGMPPPLLRMRTQDNQPVAEILTHQTALGYAGTIALVRAGATTPNYGSGYMAVDFFDGYNWTTGFKLPEEEP